MNVVALHSPYFRDEELEYMGFNLANLDITVRTDDPSRLRYRLPLLGNEFASACRSLSCCWPKLDCESCSLQETCGWHLVFGQKLTSDPAALKRHQKPPLPFVFSFPIVEVLSEMQKEIVCGLVVVGRAIHFLEMLLGGFAELLSGALSEIPSEIIQIACRDYQDSVQPTSVGFESIRSGNLVPGNLVIVSTDGLLESRIWSSTELHVRLMSPLRLFEDSRPVVQFDFSRFARSVMRRVSSLGFYYGESEFDCDFKELSRQIDDIICAEDHFYFTNSKNKKMTGISGYGSFIGDFSRLVSFLVIGSYVHTGKGSSFGMGAYEVLTKDSN